MTLVATKSATATVKDANGVWRTMTDLTKKETAYFITFALVALTIMFGGLFLWSKTQVNENCWSKYETEEQAIIKCEGE